MKSLFDKSNVFDHMTDQGSIVMANGDVFVFKSLLDAPDAALIATYQASMPKAPKGPEPALVRKVA